MTRRFEKKQGAIFDDAAVSITATTVTPSAQKRKHTEAFVNIAVCFLLAALILTIAGTFAQVTDGVKHNENKGYIDVKLVQTYGPGGDTAVYPGFTQDRTCSATNYGSEVAFVRLRLDKYWATRTWQDGAEVLTRTDDPQYNTDYILINLDDTQNWVDGEDGWYYYAQSVTPGAQTSSLLSSVGISEQVGEERNDVQSTDTNYNSKSSIYLDKAGVVDVELQAVTTEYDPDSGDGNTNNTNNEPSNTNNGGTTGGDTADNTDTSADSGTAGGDGTSSGAGSAGGSDDESRYRYAQTDLKEAFAPETGDNMSQLAVMLFTLAGISFVAFLLLLIASKRRNSKK